MGRINCKDRHPFDGRPPTREVTDANGNPVFHVNARVLTPLPAKVADKLGSFTALAASLACLAYAMQHFPPLVALVFATAFLPLQPLFEKLWRVALRRKIAIVVTKDEFRFRRRFRWISFDRALEHSVALVVHDRARAERECNELEMQKAQLRRKAVQPRRYYRDSYHLTYQLLRQRNDIVAIYGLPEARAMLSRLRAIEDTINARAHRSDGSPSKPGDQWFDGPARSPPMPDGVLS